MPASVPDQSDAGRKVAVAAESLYLINLMLLPGLAFFLLAVLFFAKYAGTSDLARNHLSQTTGVSLVGGVLIMVILALYFLLGGFGPYAWVWAVLYFTCVHTSLIFMGIFGFIKALNGERFVFPLLGRMFHR